VNARRNSHDAFISVLGLFDIQDNMFPHSQLGS
jgi:hypothetical protein